MITINSKASVGTGSNTVSSVSVTVLPGLNKYMFIFCHGDISGGAQRVSTVKVNGKDATLYKYSPGGVVNKSLEVWVVPNPAPGVHDVVVTWSANNYCGTDIVVLNDVDPLNPIGFTYAAGENVDIVQHGERFGQMMITSCTSDNGTTPSGFTSINGYTYTFNRSETAYKFVYSLVDSTIVFPSGGNINSMSLLVNPAWYARNPISMALRWLRAGNVYLQSLTDSTTITDSVLRNPGKVLSQVLSISTVFFRTTSRTFADAVVLIDSIISIRIQNTIYSEVITLADSIIRNITKVLTQTLSVVDTVLKFPARSIMNTVSISASMVKAEFRTLSETITLLTSMIKGRTFSQVITISATALKSIGIYLEQTVSLTATLIKTPNRTLSQAISLSATMLRTIGKVWAEVLSILATVPRSISRTILNIVDISDDVLVNPSRFLTEAITLTASILKTPGKVLTEVISLADTILRIPARILSQTITLTATMIRTGSRILTQVVSLTSVFTSTLVRILSEIVSLNDIANANRQATFAEVVTFTATLLKKPIRLFTELITITTSFAHELPRLGRKYTYLSVKTIRSVFKRTRRN